MDTCLAAAACRCRQLQEVDISDCPAVTDLGFELLSDCRFLQVLRAPNCVAVTDAGVQALALGCHFLRLVDISGCTAVTEIIASSWSSSTFVVVLWWETLVCAHSEPVVISC